MKCSAAKVFRRIRRFFRMPPQGVTHVSLDDPIDVRYTRNSPSSAGPPSALRIRTTILQFTQYEMAESKLRRHVRTPNADTGIETRQGDCALCYRPASKRSTSRWCGPAEVVGAERDAVALPHRGGICKVPRTWEEPYVSSATRSCEGPIGPPPSAVRTRIPDNCSPLKFRTVPPCPLALSRERKLSPQLRIFPRPTRK